jgi:mxaJ protein
VCADPDYMPFSNRAGQGFENKIAQHVAQRLGTTVKYTWASIRGNGGYDQFIHDYLNAGKCDVVVNVPYASENLTATDPYYVSSYVFIYPKAKNYPITSLDSPVLKKLRIGFEADTPAQTGLQMRALILHSTVFDIGDTEGASPLEMLDALENGETARRRRGDRAQLPRPRLARTVCVSDGDGREERQHRAGGRAQLGHRAR